MATFGNIKNKILVKLTESYGKKNFKNNLNTYFKPITKNDTLKEMYSLYEELEGKTFEDKDTATLYVEELSKVLKERHIEVSEVLDQMNESLSNTHVESNELYQALDRLSTEDKLGNISEKVIAKKFLVKHLTTSKVSDSLKVESGVNESLLNSVLTNNFNVSFDKTLSEEDKTRLKDILSISNEDLNTKFGELTENIKEKLDSIVESDAEFKTKSIEVKTEINEMSQSKYNLYRLEELLSNLSE
jgi:hypothetical protein